MKRNAFGQALFIKKNLVRLVGLASYSRFNWKNTTDIQGADQFQYLPKQNVLIVSNHQTYFADVALMFHVIQSALDGKPNDIKSPKFLKCKKPNVYFVAAEETMKSGLLPKLFSQIGAITVQRTWRSKGKDVKREVNTKDTSNIGKALSDGWVISFPQGTTTPFAPGRKGTAHIIKTYQPTVVPVMINGFRRAFDKKGFFLKKKGTTLSLWVKPPLKINYNDDVDAILKQVMDSIEQSPAYNLVHQQGEKMVLDYKE